MTTRLTDGDRVLALYTDRERRYWATLTPPGTARAIPLHRVAPLLARYRRGGWVDPTALARHRAAIANGERSLLASARDPDRRALTAALVRQLLAEVPGRSRTAAAALLGITRQSLLRAIAAIPALHRELAADPTARGGGWRNGHVERAAARRRPVASTDHPIIILTTDTSDATVVI